MTSRIFTKAVLAAALAASAVTGASTVSFAQPRHHFTQTRNHDVDGYGYAFRPDVNVRGTAGTIPDYNAPGVSPLDPCGDVCDSAMTGGGS